MSFQVTLQPSGLGFSASSDETVLEAALAGGLILPYSCRDGACGVCKSKVLSGEVDHGRYAESTLTADGDQLLPNLPQACPLSPDEILADPFDIDAALFRIAQARRSG